MPKKSEVNTDFRKILHARNIPSSALAIVLLESMTDSEPAPLASD